MATSRCDRAPAAARALRLLVAIGAALPGGCARAPRLIEKRVGDRVVITRAVPAAAYAHVARAELYLLGGRPADAAAELERALALDPEAAELHARLAELRLELDQVDEAERAVQRSLAIAPTVPGGLARARLLTARDQPRAAVLACKEALALADPRADPELAARAYLELGEAQLRALDPEAALATFSALLARLPDSLDGRLRAGALAWALGDLGQARQQLEALRARAPDFLDAQLLHAALLVAAGDRAGAESAFAALLARTGDDLQVGTAYVRWLSGTGATARALEYVRERLHGDTDPDTLPDRIALARAARAESLALTLVREALAAETAPAAGTADAVREAARQVALALAEAELHDDARAPGQALAALDAAASRVRRRAEVASASAGATAAWAWAGYELALARAVRLAKLGRAGEARRLLDGSEPRVRPSADPGAAPTQAAPHGDPEHRRARLRLALARAELDERSGDPAQARARLQRFAREEGSALDRDARAELLVEEAAIADRAGDWQAALALAERALALRPGSPLALNFAAFVAAEHRHELDVALPRARAAAALQPASAAILDTVGWVLHARGQLAEATAFLQQAARLAPDEPEILEHLATARLASGAPDEAVALLRRARERAADDRARARIEAALRAAEAAARPPAGVR